MAAKVVMVAVPTVLGIASIRVYSVSEAPAGGLLAREKLNIYTPLPWSAQAEFVPERPGVIESGLTKARESILPFIQAVKVACVSVKMGSVNLYHAGEDAYYYLRDPPPGFLPRFGTITMAGLLGMFLARKGSRFKRLAIPLGLMSAGASVCYPAQAVVLFKVTGKKVYNAGQWSSAVVSSLLTSKPQEPIAKETTASQPQSATSSNVESEVVEDSEPRSTTDNSPQSATVPETKVETAVSVPVFDEPIAAVKKKEASSLTLTEILPEQASTETNTGALLHSVPAETVTTSPSEEQPAPVESEESSDNKQIPEEISNEATPAESTASLESGTLEVAPADSAEVELAPSSKEPPAPEASDKPAVPVVESAEPEPTAQPELSEQPPVAALEETPFPTVTPPKLDQPAAENNKEGSVFKPDPSLMDFGQANPEDEDLYSTRS